MQRKLKALIVVAGLCAFAASEPDAAPSPAASELASSAPVCRPACDACHVCVQFSGPPGGTHPPTCAVRMPKPLGCP